MTTADSHPHAETRECAHCGNVLLDIPHARCRHGAICGKCEWELDAYSSIDPPQYDGEVDA